LLKWQGDGEGCKPIYPLREKGMMILTLRNFKHKINLQLLKKMKINKTFLKL